MESKKASGGRKVNQVDAEVILNTTRCKNKRGTSKIDANKLRKSNKKQTANKLLVKKNVVSSPKTNVRKSKRPTQLQTNKSEKSVVSTPVLEKTNSQADGNVRSNSSPPLKPSDPDDSRNSNIEVKYSWDQPSSSKGAAFLEQLKTLFKTRASKMSKKKKVPVRKTKSHNSKEVKSGPQCKGSKKNPAKGYLKGKRRAKREPKKYDDIFDSPEYAGREAYLLSRIPEADFSSDISIASSDSSSIKMAPELAKHIPQVQDKITTGRKSEKKNKRNTKGKNKTNKASTSKTPVSSTKRGGKKLTEKRKLFGGETKINVKNIKK